MPVVFLTPNFQKLGETPEKIEVDGISIKSVIDNVNKLHPGFKDLLIENNRIKPGISIVVNGEIKRTGLLGSVS